MDRRSLIQGAIAAALLPRAGFARHRGGVALTQITFDYYISPTGDDNNAGTEVSPWAITTLLNPSSVYATTAGKTNRTMLAGKTVGVLPGTYSLAPLVDTAHVSDTAPILDIPSGTSGNPTVIQSTTQSGAILDAGNTAGGGDYDYAPAIGQNYTEAGYVTVTGFVIQNCNGGGANFYYDNDLTPSDVTVQNCEIKGITTTVQGNNPGMVRLQGVTGALVTNNLIHDYGANVETNPTQLSGIISYYGYECTYSNNYIYYTSGAMNVGIHGKGAGGETDNHENTIAWNWIETTDFGVLDFSSSFTGYTTTYHHNVINAQVAIAHSGQDSTVALDASSVVAYNNTLYFNGSDTGGGFAYIGTSVGAGLTFYNNVIQLTGTTTGYLGEWNIVAGSLDISDYNCYTASATASSVLAAGSSSNWNSSPTTYTLPGWQTEFSTDAHSIAEDDVLNSPTLGMLSSYEPATDSPILNAGRTGGNSGGSAVNMGAFDGTGTPGPNWSDF